MGENSARTSGAVIDLVVQSVEALNTSHNHPFNINLLEQFSSSWHNEFRKLAHFTEYTILGVLLYRFFYYIIKSRTILYPIIMGIVYAALDEWHQCYVPGRSGEVPLYVRKVVSCCKKCFIRATARV